MNKENNFELDQKSIENIQNLFQELLFTEDIESERKMLQEHGIDINEKDFEAFHHEKNELLKFVKNNKNELSKLDVEDLVTVTGGALKGPKVTVAQFVNGLGKAAAFFIGPWFHGSKSMSTIIFDQVIIGIVANFICDNFVTDPKADVFKTVYNFASGILRPKTNTEQ